MENAKSIIPIWQEIGKSTHLIAHQIAQELGVKTSHTGTLDPMAQGVVIVLAGDERLRKYDYAKWLKTYEFEILFGISTDTYDGMGLINEIATEQPTITIPHIKKVLKGMEGAYTQQIPNYSAIKVKGKPMHWHARNPSEILNEKPTRSGMLSEFNISTIYEIPKKEALSKIIENIALVEGDFRQQEIIKQWEDLQINTPTFKIAKFTVTTTKGLYIRTISQDICSKLNTCGFVYSLTRTKNGEYNKENCMLI